MLELLFIHDCRYLSVHTWYLLIYLLCLRDRGETTLLLSTLAALSEDPGFIVSTHMATNNCPQCSSRELVAHFWSILAFHPCGTQTYGEAKQSQIFKDENMLKFIFASYSLNTIFSIKQNIG